MDTLHAEAHPLADVEEVEKELVHLWRQLGGADDPVMRARVVTLILVAAEERENDMAELLAQLSARHPARNLLLLLGEGEADHLDAMATMLCTVRGRKRCAEQIRLHATGAARARLGNAVLTLLTANLPVVLWWTGSPAADDALFEELAGMADHVMFDSALLCEVEPLRAALPRWQAHCASDLNWSRLAPWRESIARFFDPPAQRGWLEQLHAVRIEGGACRVSGWLLMGWLASRLGWQLAEGHDGTFRFTREAGEAVEVTLAQGGADPKNVQAVTLEAGPVTLRVRRTEAMAMESVIEQPGHAALQRITPATDWSDPILLSRQLDMMLARNAAYSEALAMMGEALEIVA